MAGRFISPASTFARVARARAFTVPHLPRCRYCYHRRRCWRCCFRFCSYHPTARTHRHLTRTHCALHDRTATAPLMASRHLHTLTRGSRINISRHRIIKHTSYHTTTHGTRLVFIAHHLHTPALAASVAQRACYRRQVASQANRRCILWSSSLQTRDVNAERTHASVGRWWTVVLFCLFCAERAHAPRAHTQISIPNISTRMPAHIDLRTRGIAGAARRRLALHAASECRLVGSLSLRGIESRDAPPRIRLDIATFARTLAHAHCAAYRLPSRRAFLAARMRMVSLRLLLRAALPCHCARAREK